MAPDAIAEEALLTVSRWQRMTPQDHASHLLQVRQARRHLKRIYRFVDGAKLVPGNDNVDEYERGLDVLRKVLES
jgi:hypothetical protein